MKVHVLMLSAILFVAACGKADNARAPQPAQSTIDASTPKAAVKSVYDLVKDGKFEDAKACFAKPANDAEKDLLENGWSNDVYSFPLYNALKEKFPAEAGKGLPDIGKMIDFLKTAIDGAAEKIEGDKATLTPNVQGVSGPAVEPVSLLKVGAEWKLVIEPGRFLHKVPDNFRAANNAMAELMTTLVAEVKAGKFTTYEQATKAIDQRRQELMKKYVPATSGPASGPASTPR
jgi:hypothetical protein